MKIGIIGGTGFYEMHGESIEINTQYGNAKVIQYPLNDCKLFFISRHGKKSILPHKINYHANIQALKNCGVETIFSLNTVGSMKTKIAPGSLFIPSDYIDITGRNATYFSTEIVHIDMSHPFCPIIRNRLSDEAKKQATVHEGVYYVTNGPRFETEAEINMFKKFADVVGMTVSPEVSLARELRICYVSLCTVSNYATGLQKKVDIKDIASIYSEMQKKVLGIIYATIENLPEERNCVCKTSVACGTL